MSKGKGGSTDQKIELDPRMEEVALRNLKLAEKVARMPYAPNMGITTAAFTPQQNAAFGASNAAAGALGLPSYGGPNTGMGMPTPQTVGGIQGYSTRPFYENALAQLPEGFMDLYNNFMKMPKTKRKDEDDEDENNGKRAVTPTTAYHPGYLMDRVSH